MDTSTKKHGHQKMPKRRIRTESERSIEENRRVRRTKSHTKVLKRSAESHEDGSSQDYASTSSSTGLRIRLEERSARARHEETLADENLSLLSQRMRYVDGSTEDFLIRLPGAPRIVLEGTVRGHRHTWEGYRPLGGRDATTRYVSSTETHNVYVDRAFERHVPLLQRYLFDERGVNIEKFLDELCAAHNGELRQLDEDGEEQIQHASKPRDINLHAVALWLCEKMCFKLYLVFAREYDRVIHVLVDYFYVLVDAR